MNAPRLPDLHEIGAAVRRELAACVRRGSGHPWRTGVLATVDGDRADARTVVLREWDEPADTLVIYTDARSPKLQQVLAHPLGTLVLWSPALGWQLRLEVALSAEVDGLAVSSRWAQLKMTPAAHDYLSPLPPGTPLDQPAAPPTPARESREHFAVLAARVQATDWLELHAQGHRRARFDAQGARWVAP